MKTQVSQISSACLPRRSTIRIIRLMLLVIGVTYMIRLIQYDLRLIQYNDLSSNTAGGAWPPIEIVNQWVDANNGIVILIVNCGYMDMADNLISSMERLPNDETFHNFVIVPLDTTSFQILSKVYPGHVLPLMPTTTTSSNSSSSVELSAAVDYGSRQFHRLTASRATILKSFLQLGYAIFYCDLDTVWNQNALSHMHQRLAVEKEKEEARSSLDFPSDTNTTREVEISRSHQRDPLEAVFVRDSGSTYCTCQIYMHPTRNNLELITQWERKLSYKKHEQDQRAFNYMMNNEGWNQNVSSVTLGIRSPEFPIGRIYFNQWAKGKGNPPTIATLLNTKVVVVHNNFIVGHERKVWRFKEHGLWNPSGKLENLPYNCSSTM
mmetsp:Transcript_4601/g.6639  ORF Transcript_4601/g.6639 Transcript_4601/m.6639 type:complete len:379 (-) Transcript_4601:42-1178(-)